jgi:predicted Zn-dependent protease
VTGAEALALSERLVEVAPGRAATWSLRGAVSSRIGADLGLLPDSAAIIREAYARSIALEPRLPWDRMAWAVYERSLGEPDRARALVMAAVAEEPNLIAGWAFLAQLDLEAGDRDGARRHADRARSVLADNQYRIRSAYDLAVLELSPVAQRAIAEAAP